MPRLILLGGAPGSGKSTLAHALAQDLPGSLALDIDQLKHAIGGWEDDPSGSGLQARRLALALVREQLRTDRDVVIGQYLARTAFIEELEETAAAEGARFLEIVLDVDVPILVRRLAHRAEHPDRAEHAVNVQLVGPEDAQRLLASLDTVRRARPAALWVDARGSVEETLEALRELLRDRPAPL